MPTAQQAIAGLTDDQRAKVAQLEDDRQWARTAVDYVCHAMAMAKARYFILGATGLDLEEDHELEGCMALCSRLQQP